MENKVELIGFYGSDITHAQSAWISTSRDLNQNKINRISELLKMLAENGHETPFEKSSLHFLVTCDQASHIHLLKHRIGVSINAESARYKELKEDKAYFPEDWSNISYEGYPNYPFMFKDGTKFDWIEILNNYTKIGNQLYHDCLDDLTPILGRKRAKESARFFKTMNSQITMDVMFNFRSFVHFQRLRNSKDAQKEIADIADNMLELVESIDGKPFEYTLKAFNL
jgi:flavin-dependent thymidylate synthase